MTPEEVLAWAVSEGLTVWREGTRLRYRGLPPSTELMEALRLHKHALLDVIGEHTIPSLPADLVPLVRAAASDSLSGSALLESGMVRDVGRYVNAWAASYLLGDRDHAVRRLREARKWWSS